MIASPRAPVIGVGLMFASNGAVLASLLPWYPAITRDLALRPSQFGWIVASFAVGAILSSALPSPLIARFGAGPVTITSTALAAVAIVAAGSANFGLALAAGLFFAGFADAVADVAQNVVGIRVQSSRPRPILSSMHALWSLGAAGGGALATWAARSGVALSTYLIITGVTCTALAWLGVRLVGPLQAGTSSPARPAQRPSLKTGLWVGLPLVAIAVAGISVEDVANNWGAMAADQLAGFTQSTAGVAFAVALASQCVGRFTGDWLTHQYGAAAMARLGGALISVGGLAVAFAASPGLLLSGFALAGFGSATLVPNAMAAGARLPGLSDNAGVTLVSWLMRVGFLVTSPIIGVITEASSLRIGLLVLVVAGLVAALLATALPGKRELV